METFPVGTLLVLNKMTGMFNGANNFNQPLNSWDVSNVTNLNFTFANATILIKIYLIGILVVSKMEGTFLNARAFNQTLTRDGNKWNTSVSKL